MTETELLLWARGPGLTIATIILVGGTLVRLLEIFLMGRKANLATARGSETAGGFGTVFRRSIPDAGTFKRSAFTIIAGYIFHIGLFIVIFLFVPHILLFKSTLGVSWPGIPSNVVDGVTVITIIALLAVLVHRLLDPVTRLLSDFNDYLVWFATILPLITGWMAFNRVGLTGPSLLALHILSVEFLMVLFPFTKLSHAFTIWIARWYNGAIAGYKGVQS
jgi:nitrate reductase gamma subunit